MRSHGSLILHGRVQPSSLERKLSLLWLTEVVRCARAYCVRKPRIKDSETILCIRVQNAEDTLLCIRSSTPPSHQKSKDQIKSYRSWKHDFSHTHVTVYSDLVQYNRWFESQSLGRMHVYYLSFSLPVLLFYLALKSIACLDLLRYNTVCMQVTQWLLDVIESY